MDPLFACIGSRRRIRPRSRFLEEVQGGAPQKDENDFQGKLATPGIVNDAGLEVESHACEKHLFDSF